MATARPNAGTPMWSMANYLHGPFGMFEQEDGENWDQSTRSTLKRCPLNFAMNRNGGEVKINNTGGPHIDTYVDEHAQLWL